MSFWTKLGQRISGFFVWALEEHPGKFLGTSLGLLIGLCIVILGFWRTLVLLLFVAAGFLIGKRYDQNKNFITWLEKFFDR